MLAWGPLVKAQICWKSGDGMTGPTGEFCLVFGVELLANGSNQTKLKFGKPETAPAFSSGDQRTEHQIENGLFAEAVGNDLQPAALLDEQTFKKIGRARGPAVGYWQPKMRNTGLKVVLEAGDRGWQRGCVVRPMPLASSRVIARDGAW